MQARRRKPSRDGIIHPRTAALGGARVKIKVELPHQRARPVVNRIKAHVRMPARRLGGRDGQAVERFDQFEHAGHDRGFGQILLNFLLRERVARHAQFFRGIRDVPGFEFRHAEFRAREIVEFLQIAPGVGPGAHRKFIQKIDHLLGRFRHLRFERIFGVVVKAQQLRKLFAQSDDVGDERRVVEIRFAEFGRARSRGVIHQFAKRAIIGVLHHRQIRRRMQREFPSGIFVRSGVGFSGFARGLTHILGQSR